MNSGEDVTHESGWKAKVVDGRGEVVTVKAEDDRYSGTYHIGAFKEYKEVDNGESTSPS